MDLSRFLQLTLLLALASITTTAPTSRDERREPTRITWFGERPAFSPNGSTLAFMSKSYGDAFSYDIETGRISLITQYPNQGYLRVQYMPNGDLFLIGAREFEDFAITREEDMEMWILKPGSLEPVALGQKIFEGVAISYQNSHIAWANTAGQYPDQIAENETIIYEADIRYNATGYPSLENKREVIREYAPECLAEPQDFRKDDTELIYNCYRITEESRVADVRGVNVDTGEVTIYRNVSMEYNEVEGIYPGGEYTTVESAHDQEDPDDNYAIEVWRLKLEPNSQDFVRLTWLSDNPGDKAGNPVVSPDGKYMSFSLGKALDEPPGAGYGLFLLELDEP
ncbi:hypothetical protein LTR37_009426 [Vermiconidia calcicola]|uniref:Uncharacterized protein n=1 Tax=Vermiconidia calcicola TaxID=1690605 RepID=A0ACC3N9A0_9PEZI|nr:hypothetical protein LTR37_009426 [Vermiconidia calcicola]